MFDPTSRIRCKWESCVSMGELILTLLLFHSHIDNVKMSLEVEGVQSCGTEMEKAEEGRVLCVHVSLCVCVFVCVCVGLSNDTDLSIIIV